MTGHCAPRAHDKRVCRGGARSPDAVHNRVNTKGSLAKGSSITISFRNHKPFSQTTYLLNLGKNTRQPIIPCNKQDLQLPPFPSHQDCPQ